MDTTRLMRNGRRGAIAAALTALPAVALGAPAGAQTPQPTLGFDRACYAEGMTAHFTGSGYTPGGPVTLLLMLPLATIATFDTGADAAGSLNGHIEFPREDAVLQEEQPRGTLRITANDRTRIDAGAQPPESQFGFAQLTFTRWGGAWPDRFVPGRRVSVEADGWAFAAGETAWLQFRKGSRAVASVRLGRLAGPCGDRRARVRVPASLKPGRYRTVLSTERRTLSERYSWGRGRVLARRSAASAAVDGARSMSTVSPRPARRASW